MYAYFPWTAIAAFMPRFMSGSFPTCFSEPVFRPAAGTCLAMLDPTATLSARSGMGAVQPFEAVQSDQNRSAVGATASGPLSQSTGCAPVDPGSSATAAKAIVAAPTWRTRVSVIKPSPSL